MNHFSLPEVRAFHAQVRDALGRNPAVGARQAHEVAATRGKSRLTGFRSRSRLSIRSGAPSPCRRSRLDALSASRCAYRFWVRQPLLGANRGGSRQECRRDSPTAPRSRNVARKAQMDGRTWPRRTPPIAGERRRNPGRPDAPSQRSQLRTAHRAAGRPATCGSPSLATRHSPVARRPSPLAIRPAPAPALPACENPSPRELGWAPRHGLSAPRSLRRFLLEAGTG